MPTPSRWHGLAHLLTDAVEHGSRAVERVHLETAARPFFILEHIPAVAEPARLVHRVHDVCVGGVYGSIRLVNGVVKAAADVALQDPPDT